MKNLKLSITGKIFTGLFMMLVTLLTASLAGYISTSRLSDSLSYITGAAWDTADGAMEGSIGIQQQIIVSNQIINATRSGTTISNIEELKAGQEMETEALGRMFAAGEISEEKINQVKPLITQFSKLQDQLIADSSQYVAAYKVLENSSTDFIELMGLVETVGDTVIGKLANEPDKTLTWTDISAPWKATGGSMKMRIALLESLHQYRQYVDGVITKEQAQRAVAKSLNIIEGNIKELSSIKYFSAKVPGGAHQGRTYLSALQETMSEHKKNLTLATKKYATFTASSKEYINHSQRLLDELEALEVIADGAVEGEMDNIQSTVNSAYTMVTGALLAGILLVVLAIFLSIKLIAQPLKRVSDSLSNISEGEGDLTAKLNVISQDEVGEIADGFNKFVEKIRSIIIQVSESTTQLSTATEQVISTTKDAKDNVRKQKAETEQVATAMNEMSATASEVANSANDAATAAGYAKEQTSKGQEVVKKTIDVINHLSDDVTNAAEVIETVATDSNNIGSVLDVIKEIAEQTNLLALNAAIEAARAGEQGRGFAVVADEVRTLASRTQESTQEIQSMIECLQDNTKQAVETMKQSRMQAESGVECVNNTGTALLEIITAVSKISDLNHQIATAAEQQSAVSGEINRNIVNIDQISDNNVEFSQRIENESQSMENLSLTLRRLVNQFKI